MLDTTEKLVEYETAKTSYTQVGIIISLMAPALMTGMYTSVFSVAIPPYIEAYQTGFWFVAGVTSLGVMMGSRLKA